MSDPKRWLTSLEEAPPGVSKLLSAYSAAPPMPADVHARLLAKAAKLSTLKPLGMAALLASKPAAAVVAVAIAGTGAVATITQGGSAPAVKKPLVTALAPVARVAHVSRPAPENQPSEPIVSVEQLAAEPPEPPAAPSKPVPSFAHSLVEEADLVDRARAALETDPERTLRLCQEHARRFPNGQLGSSREALNMRALRKLGRAEEAREHARELLDRDPGTLHAEEASKVVEEK